MFRSLIFASSLAVVASPALAAAAPVDFHNTIVFSIYTVALGLMALVLLLALVGRQRILAATALCGLATVLISFGIHPAFAQASIAGAVSTGALAQPATDTAIVTVPYGTWLTSGAAGVQEIVVSIIMGLIAFAGRKLPKAVGAVLKGLLTQQLVERAIAFGMNTVTGAVNGRRLDVSVGNVVLANALNYAITHAPEWFVKWVGGASAIRDHIIALLPMDAESTLQASTPTAQGTTTSDPVKLLG